MVIEGMLIGGGVFLAGMIADRLLPPRRRGPKPRKDPKPICGCGHHHSFHDPATGQCHGMMRGEPIKYDSFKDPTAWAQVPCTCRTYSGPVPLPEYVAPEIGAGS